MSGVKFLQQNKAKPCVLAPKSLSQVAGVVAAEGFRGASISFRRLAFLSAELSGASFHH